MNPMSVIILGAGPAGIAAALEASSHGADVTVVSAERPGGRATWHSLLPSKVYLTAADQIWKSRQFSTLGLDSPLPIADLPALRERIAHQQQAWSAKQSSLLLSHGVRFISGKAHFTDSTSVSVESDLGLVTQNFDRAIIATGSVPIFFPNLKPDGKRLLAPRFASQFTEWPEKVIVVGGGVTGAEFVYLFNTMGSQVEWVTDLPTFLPRSDEDICEALETIFLERGVILHRSSPVLSAAVENDRAVVTLQNGSVLRGTHAFLAIGRRGDFTSLNLEQAYVQTGRLGILTDAYGLTSQSHIYAVGDVAGPPFVVNRGLAQARIAVRHALGLSTPPYQPETTLEAVYTSPQIAQVGLSADAAAKRGIAAVSTRIDFERGLKPSLENEAQGFLKLISDRSGLVLGAAAIGEHAAELLIPVTVAIKAGWKVSEIAELFPAHPTFGELPFIVSRGY